MTFLFTDIEGSTRLWEHHPEAMRENLAQHDHLLRAAIERHQGHVFKTIGDAFCAAFPSAEEGVAAALEAQRSLRREVPELRVRMALHSGEAQARDGDYFGPALNRVARLLAAGHGSQVLLSKATAELAGSALPKDTELRLLGMHRLRDIVATETIFQLQPTDLPSRFPPLNTLDIAYRRGLLRASAISLVVMAVISALAVTAVLNARRANENARREALQRRRSERLLYAAQMNLAAQAVDVGQLGRALDLLEEQRPQLGREDLRGFEWRYLWRRCQGDQRFTLRGHSQGVQGVALSPDGKTLASASADGTVKLWDLATPGGTPRARATLRGHQAGVYGVAFSPDGKLLASSGDDGSVKLWDVGGSLRSRAQRAVRRAPPEAAADVSSAAHRAPRTAHASAASPPRTLRGHTGRVRAIAFAQDGKRLASGGDDARVRLWDVASGREVDEYEAPGPVACLAFSPDGATIASGSDGETWVWLWDLAAQDGVAMSRGGGYVWGVAFAPDGRTLATASSDNVVRILEVATGREAASFPGHHGSANSVAFSPDGETLASGSSDSTVKLWDVATKQATATLIGHTAGISAVAFSADGKTLVSSSWDATVRLWDARPSQGAVLLHPGWIESVAYSPNGKILASGGWTHSPVAPVKLWDAVSGRELAALNPPGFGISLAFSPDGKTLAMASEGGLVSLWDVASPGGRGDGGDGAGYPRSGWRRGSRHAVSPRLPVSPSPRLPGRPVASRPRALLRGHQRSVNSVAFSPDGKLLVAAGADRTLQLWDVSQPQRRPRELVTLKGHTDAVNAVAFSPDGTLLASASERRDATVKLWDLTSLEEVASLPAGVRGQMGVPSLAFAPGGKILASALWDGQVTLWDVASATNETSKHPLQVGHFSQGPAMAFAPDGQRLATAHADGKIRIWNPAIQQEVATLTGHRGSVRSLAFSPDGNTLASCSTDGTVRLWRAATFAQTDALAMSPRRRAARYQELLFVLSPPQTWR